MNESRDCCPCGLCAVCNCYLKDVRQRRPADPDAQDIAEMEAETP